MEMKKEHFFGLTDKEFDQLVQSCKEWEALRREGKTTFIGCRCCGHPVEVLVNTHPANVSCGCE